MRYPLVKSFGNFFSLFSLFIIFSLFSRGGWSDKTENGKRTTNREQRVLARYAEVRRKKSLRSRINGKRKTENGENDCTTNKNDIEWHAGINALNDNRSLATAE